MTDDKFNKYCTEVMGRKEVTREAGEFTIVWYTDKDDEIIMSGEYNPYDDLNQMAEVVEKLMESEGIHLTFLDEEKIIDTCRNFIISTMEKADD